MGEGGSNREPSCLIKSGGRKRGGGGETGREGRRRREREKGRKKVQRAEPPLPLLGLGAPLSVAWNSPSAPILCQAHKADRRRHFKDPVAILSGSHRPILELLILLKGPQGRGDRFFLTCTVFQKERFSFGRVVAWGVVEGSFLWATAVHCQFPPLPTASRGHAGPRPSIQTLELWACVRERWWRAAGVRGARLRARPQTRVPAPSRDSGTQAHTPPGARPRARAPRAGTPRSPPPTRSPPRRAGPGRGRP